MKHEHTAAAPHGADLETGTVARERIRTAGPGGAFDSARDRQIVLAVVEDRLEQPIRTSELQRREQARARARFIEQRCAVAVGDSLDVALRLAAHVVAGPTIAL